MSEEHIYGQAYPDVSSIYLQQQFTHIPKNYTPTWQRYHFGSESMAELSQNETVPSSHKNSAFFCFPDYLAEENTFTAQAQRLCECASRICEPLSNFASICSSASTVTSSTLCSLPTVPAASSFGLPPSFDFTRDGNYRVPFETPTCNYDMGIHHSASMDPSKLRSQSGACNTFDDAAGGWQEPCSVESQEELEEYSLGSGYPG
jgi:hypothetical protein